MKNYYYYLIFIPILTIAENIITQIVSKRLYPQYYCEGNISKEEIKNIKKRVSGLFLYKICGVFRNSFDSIIISAFVGLIALSQFQNYYYIITFYKFIFHKITSKLIITYFF